MLSSALCRNKLILAVYWFVEAFLHVLSIQKTTDTVSFKLNYEKYAPT